MSERTGQMFRCICVFCHCCGRCHNRVTQEDLHCDFCRGPAAQIEHALRYLSVSYG
jgi:hypothetical protein